MSIPQSSACQTSDDEAVRRVPALALHKMVRGRWVLRRWLLCLLGRLPVVHAATNCSRLCQLRQSRYGWNAPHDFRNTVRRNRRLPCRWTDRRYSRRPPARLSVNFSEEQAPGTSESVELLCSESTLESTAPMNEPTSEIPAGYSYPVTAAWFIAGGVVTAIFSGSLAFLTTNADLTEVLATGMIVPSFTWVVQLSAAAIGLPSLRRRMYCGDLGRICLIGSIALLPAAAINLCLPNVSPWWSAANVLASVVLMGAVLFRLSAKHNIAPTWPLSWCLTITFNMALFLWCSWHWW